MRTFIFTSAFLISILSLPLQSQAAYRCLEQGRVIYQDTPCPNGKIIASAPPANKEDRTAALQRAAKNKAELSQIDTTRAKAEAAEAKLASQTAKETQRRAQQCKLLTMQQKWAEQDAQQAAGKKIDAAQIKARRAAEKTSALCGTP
jgi:Domain of unknown function (DUF4124)